MHDNMIQHRFLYIGAEITHLGALAGTEGQASHWVVERRWNGTTLRPPLSTLSLWTCEEARPFQPPGLVYLQPMCLTSCFFPLGTYYDLIGSIVSWSITCIKKLYLIRWIDTIISEIWKNVYYSIVISFFVIRTLLDLYNLKYVLNEFMNIYHIFLYPV